MKPALAIAVAAMVATTAPWVVADEAERTEEDSAEEGVADEDGGAVAVPTPEADSIDEADPSLRDDVVRYPPTSVRYSVIAGGAGMFGVAYALSAISAAAWPGTPGSQALYAPVVGPLIALGQSGCSEDDPDCGAIVYVRGVLYVVDTLVQLGGLALIAEGLFMTTEAEAAAPSVSLVPLVTPTTTGVGVTGRF